MGCKAPVGLLQSNTESSQAGRLFKMAKSCLQDISFHSHVGPLENRDTSTLKSRKSLPSSRMKSLKSLRTLISIKSSFSLASTKLNFGKKAKGVRNYPRRFRFLKLKRTLVEEISTTTRQMGQKKSQMMKFRWVMLGQQSLSDTVWRKVVSLRNTLSRSIDY